MEAETPEYAKPAPATEAPEVVEAWRLVEAAALTYNTAAGYPTAGRRNATYLAISGARISIAAPAERDALKLALKTWRALLRQERKARRLLAAGGRLLRDENELPF